ncbi:acyltransferase [Streptacidiphilus sp. PB12-B1b]|uniref:acyltransferase family protein n=1 Tax=Streptacidiphilus sp. PB12-B1b TaxID=2705012 RepID=UPI0015FB3A6B|nr:acyltransferase [Streptacidiphilus sp. PB12-B1b]QMU75951.1 acyltransferase [Streptacidiphilus sp. PB12-B1b]
MIQVRVRQTVPAQGQPAVQPPAADGTADGTAAAAAAARPAAARLGWLDALRGIAALAVVFQHAGPTLFDDAYRHSHQYLDAGIFGVFLFFLISGYIVPASLERRGDLRAFWAGRIFRIYPLYLVVFAAALLLLPRAHAGVGTAVFQHPWLSLAADGILLQDLLGVPNGLDVAWTLCYEMVFYFLVSALFLCGWHRRSAPAASGFAAAALFAGGLLPVGLLVPSLPATERTVAVAAATVVAALACILSGRRAAVRCGVAALGLLGLVLVLVDGRSAAFESTMILATMFTGTAIQRAERGQIRRRYAVACCAFVFTAGLLAGDRYAGTRLNLIWTTSAFSWCTAFAAAWLVFGAGMLLRRRRTPAWLSRLGAISYAVYLLHVPLLHAVQWLLTDIGWAPYRDLPAEFGCTALFLVVLLALANALHRWVELPGQRLGRRLLKGRREVRAGA